MLRSKLRLPAWCTGGLCRRDGKGAKRRGRFTPALEPLEERSLLSVNALWSLSQDFSDHAATQLAAECAAAELPDLAVAAIYAGPDSVDARDAAFEIAESARHSEPQTELGDAFGGKLVPPRVDAFFGERPVPGAEQIGDEWFLPYPVPPAPADAEDGSDESTPEAKETSGDQQPDDENRDQPDDALAPKDEPGFFSGARIKPDRRYVRIAVPLPKLEGFVPIPPPNHQPPDAEDGSDKSTSGEKDTSDDQQPKAKKKVAKKKKVASRRTNRRFIYLDHQFGR